MALFLGCSSPLTTPEKSSSGTIPIAEANTWVYKHTTDMATYGFLNDSVTRHEYRQGLFTLSINSASYAAFTITAIDSGVSTINDTCVSSFDTSYTITYSLPLKENYGAILGYGDSSPPILWTGGRISPWGAPLPYFLTYQVLPDTCISVKYLSPAASIHNYSRQTESIAVVVNSSATGKLFLTTTSYTWDDAGLYYNHNDSLKWFDGIGVINNSHTFEYLPGGAPLEKSVEHYSLISFNNSPVSVVPK